MRVDKYNQIILSENDVCDLLMRDVDIKTSLLVDKIIDIDPNLDLENVPDMCQYSDSEMTIQEFDTQCQSMWNMPDEYKNMDIALWLLEQCKTDAERQRVGEELLLYLDRDLFNLLKYMKYLVDVMRQNNIVWGVGRGSSVNSYVLFLIGIHKIDSIFYDLDIKEFLR